MLSLREQVAGRCVHFNGVQHGRCNAGVSYADLTGIPHETLAAIPKAAEEVPSGPRLPCYADLFDDGPSPFTCARHRLPEGQEIDVLLARLERGE